MKLFVVAKYDQSPKKSGKVVKNDNQLYRSPYVEEICCHAMYSLHIAVRDDFKAHGGIHLQAAAGLPLRTYEPYDRILTSTSDVNYTLQQSPYHSGCLTNQRLDSCRNLGDWASFA